MKNRTRGRLQRLAVNLHPTELAAVRRLAAERDVSLARVGAELLVDGLEAATTTEEGPQR